MIPALLETIGALSLLLSVVAKIALLRGLEDEDSPSDAPAPGSDSLRHARAACFRQKHRQDEAGHSHEGHREEGHRERRARFAARHDLKHARSAARH